MDLDVKQLGLVIKTIAEEKNLSVDAVQEVVEQALAAAYRKDFGDREQELRVSMNFNTGTIDVFILKDVVEKGLITAEEYKQITGVEYTK